MNEIIKKSSSKEKIQQIDVSHVSHVSPSPPDHFLRCPKDILWEILRCFNLKFLLRVVIRVRKIFRSCIRSGRTWVAEVPREWTQWTNQAYLKKILRSIPKFRPKKLSLFRGGEEAWDKVVSFSSVTHLRLVNPLKVGWTRESIQTLFSSLPSLKSVHLEDLDWWQAKQAVLWASSLSTVSGLESIHLNFYFFQSYSIIPLDSDGIELWTWRHSFRDLPVTKVTANDGDSRVRFWDFLVGLPLTSLALGTSGRSEQKFQKKTTFGDPLRTIGRGLVELVLQRQVPGLIAPSLTHLHICATRNSGDIWDWELLLKSSPFLTHLSLSQSRVLDSSFSFCRFKCLTSLTLSAKQWSMKQLQTFNGVHLIHLSLWVTEKFQSISNLWAFLFCTFPLACLDIRGRGKRMKEDFLEDLKTLQHSKFYKSRLTLRRLHLCAKGTQLAPEDFDLLQTCFPALKTVRLTSKPDFEIPFPHCETDQDDRDSHF